MAPRASLSREESAERAQDIATAVSQGRDVKSVAAEFGISVGTAYACCRRNGVVLRNSERVGYHASAAQRRQQVLRMARQGATHREITAKLGFQEDSIRQICSDARVALRPVVRANEARVLRERQEVAARRSYLRPDFSSEQLMILRDLGNARWSFESVAMRQGRSRSYVWQVFRRARQRLLTLAERGELPALPDLPDPVQQRLKAPIRAAARKPRRLPVVRGSPRSTPDEKAPAAPRAVDRVPKRATAAVQARRREIAEAVASGLSAAQAATKFDVSPGAVYDALRDSGWGRIATPSPEEARRLAVLQLAARGSFSNTIAKKLDVSERYVRLLCKRRGVPLQSRRDRIDAARVRARHYKLADVNLRELLDGQNLRILKALRDTDLTIADIARQLDTSGKAVFDVWTRALDRLAVPKGSSHETYIAARRRVFSSGISLSALCRAVGGHQKLVQQLRRSDLSIEQLARNARMSPQAVRHIWYLALDRSAIVSARLEPIAPRSRPRRRLTKRERRVLRDLVL